MKVLSPIQRMQKDREIKSLKQHFNRLKEKEEGLVAGLVPLKEEASILSQVLTDNKEELASVIQ